MRELKFQNSSIVLIHEDRNDWLNIEGVEQKFKAKYVGEFSIKQSDGRWMNRPVSIFHTPVKHPDGSNYFGVYTRKDVHDEVAVFVTNGISAAENIWTAVYDPAIGKAIYSAYRHDFQQYLELIADGGPDYLRSSIHGTIQFTCRDGQLVVVD